MDNYTVHAQAAISALQRSGVTNRSAFSPELFVAAAQVEAILALAAAVASLTPVPGDRPS